MCVCGCVWLCVCVTSAGRRYGKHPPRHAIAAQLNACPGGGRGYADVSRCAIFSRPRPCAVMTRRPQPISTPLPRRDAPSDAAAMLRRPRASAILFVWSRDPSWANPGCPGCTHVTTTTLTSPVNSPVNKKNECGECPLYYSLVALNSGYSGQIKALA